MSYEMRLKKLRGSGGYIMANVTDEQQQKGNLGGPDLFLAPVGRLDSNKISKFFCNTCEKDYEGSPKIEYENPNEEVAENLILVERGQYICHTCGSTLAEYREFQKPDLQRDVGAARPSTPDYESTFTPPAEPSYTPPPTEPSFSQPPADEPPLTMPTFDEPTSVQEPPPIPEFQTQPMDSTFSSISGMAVIDENAKRIGTAKQVGVDSSQNVVLVITDSNGSDVTVPWNNIRKIGEVILLGSSSDISANQSGKCSSCNYSNKPGSKFCEQCGAKL
ncbi:MAG: PRC-barrel domain-containing protein [Nitrosopumilaceae archaeon]